jgi:hypothetical protein
VLHLLLLVRQNRVFAQVRHRPHHLAILLARRPRQRVHWPWFGVHDWDLATDGGLLVADGGVGVGIVLGVGETFVLVGGNSYNVGPAVGLVRILSGHLADLLQSFLLILVSHSRPHTLHPGMVDVQCVHRGVAIYTLAILQGIEVGSHDHGA